MIFLGSRMMNFAFVFLGCINILLHLILYTHLIDVFPLFDALNRNLLTRQNLSHQKISALFLRIWLRRRNRGYLRACVASNPAESRATWVPLDILSNVILGATGLASDVEFLQQHGNV
jgi:hypothetical protein